MMSQVLEGITPIVVTSPFQKSILNNSDLEMIEGVKYYRTFSNEESEVVSEHKTSFSRQIRKVLRLFSFTRKVYYIAKKEDVEVLHAHAMFFCAISAKIVSLLLKKPMIYEVRSLWEERFKQANIFVRIRFELITLLETLSMFISDEIIAINKELRKQLLNRRFLVNKKIHVIPNAVDLERINIKSREDLPDTNNIVFGYIGSISRIEGLNFLISVFHRLKKSGYKNKLLIFGDGIMKSEWEDLAKGNELIEFKGRVLQSEIANAYSQIHVIVNPRIKNYLTDSVTPLKPLEAMAYNKLVMASNIGGMTEIIHHNKNGIIFKPESIIDLEQAILSVFKRTDLDNIICNANNYIINNKSWRSNAQKYKKIYKKLL